MISGAFGIIESNVLESAKERLNNPEYKKNMHKIDDRGKLDRGSKKFHFFILVKKDLNRAI